MTDRDIPALPAASPSRSLTTYLQLQFPDYFRDVFGKPGPESRLPEHTTTTADLIERPDSSDSISQTVDKCQDTSTPSSSQGHDLAENTNVSSSGCGQETSGKDLTTARVKPAKVNVCHKGPVNTPGLSPHGRHPLLTRVTESAVAGLNRKLELWFGKLKADIQADFAQITIQALETQRQSHQVDTIELMAKRQHLEWTVAELREKAKSWSESLQQKETVIDNMLQALVEQRNPQALAKALSRAQAGHVQRYAEYLATLHYEHHLTRKVVRAWADCVKQRCKEAVQVGCQDLVSSACRRLSCDYQAKIASLNEEIGHLKLQLEQMQQERQLYLVHVKKAFLRGVCALNTEAMSAFAIDQHAASTSNRAGASDASNSSHDATDIHEGDNHIQQTLCCTPAGASAVQ